MIALALALQLLATASADTTPPAPGAPKFVQIASLAGVPADSTIRAEFAAGFRGAFSADEIPGERKGGADEWKSGLPLPNHFRLLEGSAADDAWGLDVELGAPPPLRTPATAARPSRAVTTRRTSRGMIVAFTLHVPDPLGGPARVVPVRYAFAFPPTGSGGADLAIPETGYAFPWDKAGRVAGALALEALHRESGDILPAERMDIHPAIRIAAGR